ncbi:MAG TPA: EamA family transporter [Terracidiphilus sp.]|jgi:drug/metabolite transporter (DMT)-like permease|nr:EamA family transporter [Terracidiphilus sp.]
MKLRDALEMLLLSAVWGASFILIKLAGIDLPPVWVAFGRLTFGSLFLWAVLKLGHHKLPPLKLIGALVAVGVLNNALPFCFFAWGEQTVPSSIAAIINATTPIWALLFGLILGTAHATRLTAAGVALGFLGVLGVVYGHAAGVEAATSSRGFVFGVILIAIASLSYGAGAVAAKRWLQGIEPVVIATFQLTLAGLVLLPIAVFGTHPAALHFKSLAAVTILGVLGSGLAYLLFFRLLATISPTRTVAVTYLLPIWGLFWGFIAGEQIRWTALAGVAVVLGGLVLLNLSSHPQKAVAVVAPTEPCPAEQA